MAPGDLFGVGRYLGFAKHFKNYNSNYLSKIMKKVSPELEATFKITDKYDNNCYFLTWFYFHSHYFQIMIIQDILSYIHSNLLLFGILNHIGSMLAFLNFLRYYFTFNVYVTMTFKFHLNIL